jgi:hypothetical protein
MNNQGDGTGSIKAENQTRIKFSFYIINKMGKSNIKNMY